jgi:hypothetical protein
VTQKSTDYSMVANYPGWFSLCQINNLNRTLFIFSFIEIRRGSI